MARSLPRRLAAEAVGSALLLATVIGSGIMAERLAGGNVALALLGNTLATGAILIVLVLALGPISGAHFNPAVSAGLRSASRTHDCVSVVSYAAAQMVGAIVGVLLAHGMFESATVSIVYHGSHGTGPMASGTGRDVRSGRCNPVRR